MDALLNMVISEHHTSAMMVQGRTHRMTEMIARLAPGATVDQAKAEAATINARVHEGVSAGLRSGVASTRSRSSRSRKSSARKRKAHAVAAHGRRRVRHDHLVRERREPDAHAIGAPRARARGSRGARRRNALGSAGLLLVENLVLALDGRGARVC